MTVLSLSRNPGLFINRRRGAFLENSSFSPPLFSPEVFLSLSPLLYKAVVFLLLLSLPLLSSSLQCQIYTVRQWWKIAGDTGACLHHCGFLNLGKFVLAKFSNDVQELFFPSWISFFLLLCSLFVIVVVVVVVVNNAISLSWPCMGCRRCLPLFSAHVCPPAYLPGSSLLSYEAN